MNEYKAMSQEIAAEFGEGWLPPRPTIEIVAPAAYPGDTVSFVNYRMKPPENICHGKVVHLETYWRGAGEYSHHYTVRPAGKKYTIHVTEIQ